MSSSVGMMKYMKCPTEKNKFQTTQSEKKISQQIKINSKLENPWNNHEDQWNISEIRKSIRSYIHRKSQQKNPWKNIKEPSLTQLTQPADVPPRRPFTRPPVGSRSAQEVLSPMAVPCIDRFT